MPCMAKSKGSSNASPPISRPPERVILPAPERVFPSDGRHVGQGRPPAPADPARDAALEGPLPKARRGRARVGRLKNEWALVPLRTRGLERVRLHADLTVLAKLSCT